MKILADTVLKTLKGEPYQTADKTDLLLGQVLAETLATDQTSGKFKLYTLAQKLFSDKIVEVDAADLSLIKQALEKTTSYNNIIIGQALGMLEDVK